MRGCSHQARARRARHAWSAPQLRHTLDRSLSVHACSFGLRQVAIIRQEGSNGDREMARPNRPFPLHAGPRRPAADCGTRPEAWPSATVTVVPVLPVAFVRSSRCAVVGLSTPAVQISAFWDAGLEPVDVAMSDLVPRGTPLR